MSYKRIFLTKNIMNVFKFDARYGLCAMKILILVLFVVSGCVEVGVDTKNSIDNISVVDSVVNSTKDSGSNAVTIPLKKPPFIDD